jgi:hypothetical protein
VRQFFNDLLCMCVLAISSFFMSDAVNAEAVSFALAGSAAAPGAVAPPKGGGGSSSSSVPKRSMLGRRSCQCQYPFATGIVEWATCRVTADTAASARSRMTTVAFCKEAFAFDMRSQPDVAARRRQMGQDGRSQRLQSCQRQSLTQREFYRASAHGGSMLSRF